MVLERQLDCAAHAFVRGAAPLLASGARVCAACAARAEIALAHGRDQCAAPFWFTLPIEVVQPPANVRGCQSRKRLTRASRAGAATGGGDCVASRFPVPAQTFPHFSLFVAGDCAAPAIVHLRRDVPNQWSPQVEQRASESRLRRRHDRLRRVRENIYRQTIRSRR